MKKILIISFKFPPMGGVGTRRWSKFAKYLANKNYEVHIITIKYNKIDKVNWLHDIDKNSNIIIHRISSGYINFLLYENKNFFVKILCKALRFILKNTLFYIDIAQNWAKYMIPYASRLIEKENISNVIVTSPPHSVAYYSTYLKIQFPEINLIQDFRDNWNDDEYYAYKDVFKLFRHKERSVYMETFAIRHSDFIVNTTQDMTDRLYCRYPLYYNKFQTIYNGFDPQDVSSILSSKILTGKKIKIIYSGSLDSGRLQAIYMLLDVIQRHNLNSLFEINIYTSYNISNIASEYIYFINKVIFFHDFVSPSDIINIISMHDYCLSINSPLYPYAFGAKVFDYMMLNKKIIHISKNGELSRLFVETNQYVADYDKMQIENMIFKVINDRYITINYSYDNFNIENLVHKIENLLK